MVWRDLVLGPALRFLESYAAGLSDEIIDMGCLLSYKWASSLEFSGIANSEDGVLIQHALFASRSERHRWSFWTLRSKRLTNCS